MIALIWLTTIASASVIGLALDGLADRYLESWLDGDYRNITNGIRDEVSH